MKLTRKSFFMILQEYNSNTNNLLLHFGGFCILLGTQDIAHKMVVQACTQCSPWVSIMRVLELVFLCFFSFCLKLKSIFHILKVCYTIWTYFWICSSCWDTFPWICYHNWSCCHWTPLGNPLVMDGSESPGDSWGALWIPFSLESLKLLSIVWGVSVKFLLLHMTTAI